MEYLVVFSDKNSLFSFKIFFVFKFLKKHCINIKNKNDNVYILKEIISYEKSFKSNKKGFNTIDNIDKNIMVVKKDIIKSIVFLVPDIKSLLGSILQDNNIIYKFQIDFNYDIIIINT